MTKKSILLVSMASAAIGISGCMNDNSCATSSDCDYPRYYCNIDTCMPNPDYKEPGTNTPGDTDTSDPRVGKKCYSKGECIGYPEIICDMSKNVCMKDPDYKGTSTDDDKDKNKEIPQMTFKLSYGSYLTSMSIQDWSAIVPENPNSTGYGKGKIVIMLCDEEDLTCKSPKHVRALTEKEGWNSAPIQQTTGPTISLYDFPAGKWKMMIFEDAVVTAENGMSYEDKNDLCKEGVDDWGCIVSEVDRMLVAKEDYEAYAALSDKVKRGIYPQPSAMDVEIPEKCTEASCTVDLGNLLLAHYHERNISIDYRTEDGYIAVGTPDGLRIIDLSKMEVMKGGTDSYDYILKDNDGAKISGIPCGLMDGGDGKTVWLIYNMNDNMKDNIAVPFDVQTQKQIGSKHVILKDAQLNSAYCRGKVVDGKMYVLSRYQGKPGGAYVLYAPDLTDVLEDEANVITTNSMSDASLAYLVNTDSIVVWHDRMYSIVGNYEFDGQHRMSNAGMCSGGESLCVFKTYSGDEGLEPISSKSSSGSFLDGGAYDESNSTTKRECRIEDYFMNVPSLALVEKSETEAWLIASKCLSLVAWKLTYNPQAREDKITETPLFLGNDGVRNLDVSDYGVYIHDWALSPDKKYLYGIPSGPSTTMLYLKQGTKDQYSPSNRMLGVVLDVSASDKPKFATDEQFNRNIDGTKDNHGDTNPRSPEIDKGLDIQQHWYHQYFLKLANNLQGHVQTFRPARTMLAASQNTLWVSRIGDGKVNSSQTTLGHYRDIATYDLKEARSILWPHENETYLHPFTASGAEDRPSGFPLDPEHFDTVNTMGIVYIKKNPDATIQPVDPVTPIN